VVRDPDYGTIVDQVALTSRQALDVALARSADLKSSSVPPRPKVW
jgi:hypothetical protein